MSETRVLRGAVPWLTLAVLALAVLGWRLQLSYDLGLFLPRGGDLEQQVVIGQLTSGPGSRLMLIGLSGDDRDALARASRAVRERLAVDPAFTQVQNGESSEDPASIPGTLGRYRFLLTDVDWSTQGLAAALGERMRDLAFGGGPELIDLVSADPYLAVIGTLEGLAPAALSDAPWFTADGTAVLLAETAAAASDIAAQQRAVAGVRAAVAGLQAGQSLDVDITGPGAFGVELQQTIRAEAGFRSTLAVAGLLLVLLVAYRRLRLLPLAGLPLGFGFLCGLAVTALVFGQVHGITLAFGFTLLGIAIDFPLHLFSHARREAPRRAMERIWPTLRAGAASTLLAYLAMALSGSPGLAQLGTFTAAGLAGAVAVTRFWLPDLLPPAPPAADGGGPTRAPRLAWLPALLVAAAAITGLYVAAGGVPWHDAPESISPVPAQRLAADHRLRSALASVDLRYQVAVTGATVDEALVKTERLEKALAGLRGEGLLTDWRAVTRLLPSQATLAARQQRIPEPAELSARLEGAASATPFDPAAFTPFLDAAASARDLPPLQPDDYLGGPLGAWVGSRLVAVDGGWVSLVSLVEPDAGALAERLGAVAPEARWIDIREASSGLFATFRSGVLRAIGVAAVLMALLLALQRLRFARIAWLAVTVGAALTATAWLAVLLHGPLTIVHLVALLLVFGLGLDYALFFSRAESDDDRRSTRHSVLACTASTTLAFGILGGSSIPFLHYIGVTTALGSLLSFALAFAGSRRLRFSPGAR
jgi:predicted exporter